MAALFAPLPVTLDEQIAAAEREVGYRVRVYARLVDAGKMPKAKADHEIAAMRAIATTLRNLKENPPDAQTLAR